MTAAPFTFGQQVIVIPDRGAPYAARFAQYGNGGWAYVRGPQGLHAVSIGSITPRTLGLGDDRWAELHKEAR